MSEIKEEQSEEEQEQDYEVYPVKITYHSFIEFADNPLYGNPMLWGYGQLTLSDGSVTDIQPLPINLEDQDQADNMKDNIENCTEKEGYVIEIKDAEENEQEQVVN